MGNGNNFCPDCGLRTSSGICSNCQEELYIMELQAGRDDDGEWEFSSDFVRTAAEQRRYLNDPINR